LWKGEGYQSKSTWIQKSKDKGRDFLIQISLASTAFSAFLRHRSSATLQTNTSMVSLTVRVSLSNFHHSNLYLSIISLCNFQFSQILLSFFLGFHHRFCLWILILVSFLHASGKDQTGLNSSLCGRCCPISAERYICISFDFFFLLIFVILEMFMCFWLVFCMYIEQWVVRISRCFLKLTGLKLVTGIRECFLFFFVIENL